MRGNNITKWTTWLCLSAGIAITLEACAANGRDPNAALGVDAAQLYCKDLEAGGASRPFIDRPGAATKLRASDLPGYDRDQDDLRRDAPVGVRYRVLATRGSSDSWLERQLYCYRAAQPVSAAADPLLVSAAHISVRKGAGAYLVDVTSRDPRVAEDVLRAAGL